MLTAHVGTDQHRRGNHRYAPLYTTFCVHIPVAYSIAALSLYGTAATDISTSLIGVVVGSAAVGSMLARPFAGALCDRIGIPPILRLGAAMVVVGTVVNAVVTDLLPLIAARLLLGLGYGAAMVAIQVWVVSTASVRRRGQSLARILLVNFLQMAAAVPLSSWLVGVAGYVNGWLIVGGVAALALFTGARATGEHTMALEHPAALQNRTNEGYRDLLFCVGGPGIALAAAFGAYATSLAYLPALRGGEGQIAVSMCGVAVVVSITVSGSIDRWGGMVVAKLSMVAVTAGSGLLIVPNSAACLMTGAVLLGLGIGNIFSALSIHVADRAPPRTRALALSLLGSSHHLGFFAGPSMAGLLAGSSLTLSFGCSTAVAAAGSLVLLRPGPRKYRHLRIRRNTK